MGYNIVFHIDTKCELNINQIQVFLNRIDWSKRLEGDVFEYNKYKIKIIEINHKGKEAILQLN